MNSCKVCKYNRAQNGDPMHDLCTHESVKKFVGINERVVVEGVCGVTGRLFEFNESMSEESKAAVDHYSLRELGATRKAFDERRLPDFHFTQDLTVVDHGLAGKKGELYESYSYNFSRLAKLYERNLISVVDPLASIPKPEQPLPEQGKVLPLVDMPDEYARALDERMTDVRRDATWVTRLICRLFGHTVDSIVGATSRYCVRCGAVKS